MAATLSPKSSMSNILDQTIDNLLIAEKQLQDKELGHRCDGDMNLTNFWKNVSIISQKLSFECTKVCICFSESPIPTPAETSSLMTAIEQAVLSLVSTFYKLSPSYGRVLRTNVQQCVVRGIQAARQLLKIIKDEGCEIMVERYRQSTGIVWQGCQKLEQCPHDNKSAVLLELRGQNSLVSDAFTEISEAMESDGSGWSSLGDEEDSEAEEKWSCEDKDMIGPSINLIKAAKILYKRILAAVEKNGSYETPEAVKELDQLEADCSVVSQTVDVLILEMYPPLNVANMEEQSQELARLLQSALKTCAQSHVATEAEKPHIEFIHKAIEHNLNQMKEKLSKQ